MLIEGQSRKISFKSSKSNTSINALEQQRRRIFELHDNELRNSDYLIGLDWNQTNKRECSCNGD